MYVLFVCTGNTCRSPMAEALFARAARERGLEADTASAGVMASEGSEASIGAQSVMLEKGIDLSGHRARQLTRGRAADADMVLCMAQSHVERVRGICGDGVQVDTLVGYATGRQGSIDDPFGGDGEVYERCAGMIEDAIIKVVEKLLSMEDEQ